MTGTAAALMPRLLNDQKQNQICVRKDMQDQVRVKGISERFKTSCCIIWRNGIVYMLSVVGEALNPVYKLRGSFTRDDTEPYLR